MTLSLWGVLLLIASIFIGLAIWFVFESGVESLLDGTKHGLGSNHEGLICFFTLILCIVLWFSFVNKFLFIKLKDVTMVESYSYNIYAIEDNKNIQGTRYYIETNTSYDYLADYKDGKKQYSVNKNDSYIVEDKETTPHIEVYVAVPKKETWYTKIFLESEDKEYKIIVPEKTLTDNFNIDLK